jgi:fibrillarin-like rRNA methylase
MPEPRSEPLYRAQPRLEPEALIAFRRLRNADDVNYRVAKLRRRRLANRILRGLRTLAISAGVAIVAYVILAAGAL